MRGLKKILHDFSESTSAHGVPHIGSAKDGLKRLFWSLIVLAALSVLSYSIFLLLQNYFSYPITVQTEIRNQPRVFPAVTICNVNPFRRTYFTSDENQMTMNEDFKKFFNRSAKTSPEGKMTYQKMNNYEMGSDYEADLSKLYYNIANEDVDLKMKAGHSLDEMFPANGDQSLSVLFDGKPVYRSDFHQWWHSLYGNCYTFNHNGKYKADKPGLKYGLKAQINVQTDEYLSTTLTSGVRVVVHDQTTEPFPESFGYTVSPGTLSQIGLRYVTSEKLSEPYGYCINKPSEVEDFFYLNDYSIEGCYKSCQQRNVLNKCKCGSPYLNLPDESTAKFCESGAKDETCVSGAEAMAADACNCPAPCKSSTYLATLSSGRYPVPGSEPQECETKADVRGEDISALMSSIGLATDQLGAALQPLTDVVGALGAQTLGGLQGVNLDLNLDFVSVFKSPLDEIKSFMERTEYLKCAKDIADNQLILNVYLEELSYQRYYEEPAYGVIDLVSDFGGQLGLWLGFSIITYIEVMLLVLTIVGFLFRGCRTPDENEEVRPFEVDYYRNQKISPEPPVYTPHPNPPAVNSRPDSVMYEKFTNVSAFTPPPITYSHN